MKRNARDVGTQRIDVALAENREAMRRAKASWIEDLVCQPTQRPVDVSHIVSDGLLEETEGQVEDVDGYLRGVFDIRGPRPSGCCRCGGPVDDADWHSFCHPASGSAPELIEVHEGPYSPRINNNISGMQWHHGLGRQHDA